MKNFVLILRLKLINREGGKQPSPFRWIRLMALAGLGAWAFLTGSLWLVVPMVLANVLRNRPYLYPEAIMWLPSFGFEMLGLWLLWRVSRV